MKRLLCVVGLAISLCAVVRADDDVVYVKDPKEGKIVSEKGTIEEETPAGIKLRQQGKIIPFAPMTIERVTYKGKVEADKFRIPDNILDNVLDRNTSRTAKKLTPEERKKSLAEALAGFEDLAKQVGDAERPLRYVHYRIAYTKVLLAHEDPKDPKLTKAAIDELAAFARSPKNLEGWEAIPALEMLSDLQQQQGKIEDAAETLEKLVKLDGLPPEMKQARTIAVAGLLMRTGKFDAAEARLKSAIGNLAANDPLKQRLEAYLVRSQMSQTPPKTTTAVADLNKIIETSTDPETKGIAYNLLGDYYLGQKKEEEAFWQYLRVHVLYKDNPEEHAKALYNLNKLFASVQKDVGKAEECADALKREDLTQTEYGRKYAAEHPSVP